VAEYGGWRAGAKSNIQVMDPAANTIFDCAHVRSWHEEMRRAVDLRDLLPQAACEAVVRVIENFLLEEAVNGASRDEALRTIALLRQPTGSRAPARDLPAGRERVCRPTADVSSALLRDAHTGDARES
jgi:hypothetical protein